MKKSILISSIGWVETIIGFLSLAISLFFSGCGLLGMIRPTNSEDRGWGFLFLAVGLFFSIVFAIIGFSGLSIIKFLSAKRVFILHLAQLVIFIIICFIWFKQWMQPDYAAFRIQMLLVLFWLIMTNVVVNLWLRNSK